MNMRTSILAVAILAGMSAALPAQILVPDQPGRDSRVRPPIHPRIRPFPAPHSAAGLVVVSGSFGHVQADVHDQIAKVRMGRSLRTRAK